MIILPVSHCIHSSDPRDLLALAFFLFERAVTWYSMKVISQENKNLKQVLLPDVVRLLLSKGTDPCYSGGVG